MWVGLFLIGALAGFLMAYLGFVGVYVIILGVVIIVIIPGARAHAGAGLVGLGVGMGALALLAIASCPAMIVTGSSIQTCEGPDLRPYLVAATLLIATGGIWSYRQLRR